MLGKRSAFLALYVILCIINMTSTASRSRHQRHQLRGEGRSRGGRHRNNNGDDDNDRHHRRDSGGFSGFRHHNRTSSFRRHQSRKHNDNNDNEGDDLDFFHTPEERQIDGITVPSLHAMQTFGLVNPSSSSPSSSSSSSAAERKERRPIRGSRKAVVITKKTYLKKEWCKTQPLKQVVRMRGCLRAKILNNFCYGQCNSFFIPKKARRSKDAEAFLSCGFCRPRRFRWILVTLRCPTKNGMRFRRKRVQYIKKCRCMAQEVTMPPMS